MKQKSSPHCERFPPARLTEEEQRIRDWFDCLSEAEQQKSYSLAEIRAAVSIPVTRLRIVMYRLGWRPRREAGFGVLTYSKPLNSPWPREVEAYRSVLLKLERPP
jgi:hypothetical protein